MKLGSWKGKQVERILPKKNFVLIHVEEGVDHMMPMKDVQYAFNIYLTKMKGYVSICLSELCAIIANEEQQC